MAGIELMTSLSVMSLSKSVLLSGFIEGASKFLKKLACPNHPLGIQMCISLNKMS